MPRYFYDLYFGPSTIFYSLIIGLVTLVLFSIAASTLMLKTQSLNHKILHLNSVLNRAKASKQQAMKKTPPAQAQSIKPRPVFTLNDSVRDLFQQQHIHVEHNRALTGSTLDFYLSAGSIFIEDVMLYLLQHAQFRIKHWLLSYETSKPQILDPVHLNLNLIAPQTHNAQYHAPHTAEPDHLYFKDQALASAIPILGSLQTKRHRSLLSLNQAKLIIIKPLEAVGKLHWKLKTVGPYVARFCLPLLSSVYCINKDYLYHVATGGQT